MLPKKFHFIWPSGFRGKYFFGNRPIRNKNCLWRQCLLTDQNKMSNLDRGSSIDAFYQVSVQLAKLFLRTRFLEIDQSEIRIACGSHVCWWIGTKWATIIENLLQMLPIKFRIIWASSFRGEHFLEINQSKIRMPMAAMFVDGSGWNHQYL